MGLCSSEMSPENEFLQLNEGLTSLTATRAPLFFLGSSIITHQLQFAQY